MEEIWKDIKGYEGKYQISNLGRVKSLYTQNQYKKTYRTLIMKLGKRNGYNVIVLENKRNNRRCYQIHRLVAEAFLKNPNNFQIINHIDENRTNNNVNNLEWCTQKYNVLHSVRKMCKPKNRIGKSGEKYIRIKNINNTTYYEVTVPYKNKRKFLGLFKDIKEAVNTREEFIKLIGKSYIKE